MSLIPEETLQAIEQGVDIVGLVSRYVELKPRGKNHVGLCPFHAEKTASLSVYADRGIWVCFGCGKKGGAFQFLMEIEGLGFREAVVELARETGIALALGPGGGDEQTLLRETTAWAAGWFAQELWGPLGEPGRRYLAGRGFSEETLRRFGVGYAPAGWDRLLGAARAAGRPLAALLRLGLVKQRDDRTYDAFRERVIFPIHDLRGRTIAFGGRIMPGAQADHTPKYINSPESPLYRKSSTLYGYAPGRETIRRTRRVVVAEGYTDVMMSHQCGQEEVVAVCGTSLTAEHAALLARLADEVVFLFDADPAGLRAAERSLELLLPHGLRIRVAHLPQGNDPHDFLLAGGAEPFARALDDAQDFFGFKLGLLAQRHDLSSPAGKAQATDELLATLEQVDNPVYRNLLCKELAEELGIDERALQERQRARRGAQRREERREAQPERRDGLPAEAFLLEVLAHRPELLSTVRARYPLGRYRNDRVRRVAQAVYAALERDPRNGLRGLLALLPDPQDASLLCAAAERTTRPEELDRHLALFLGRDEQALRRQRAAELRRTLEAAEQAQDPARIRQILSEYHSLMGGTR